MGIAARHHQAHGRAVVAHIVDRTGVVVSGTRSGHTLQRDPVGRGGLAETPRQRLMGQVAVQGAPAVEGEAAFTSWKWFMVTPSKLLFCLAAIVRTDAALAFISGFFVSTPEYDLMDGLNVLLTPLRLCRLPVRYLILVIEIIFRFIPLLVDEAVSILKTQAIRGGLGQVKGKLAKIKAVLPLIVPLIIQTIKRSEALADAITMRCFK